eukprot:15172.XXX_1285646_1285747_1 [CDS] Oithona nana genome sequencing.
MDFSVDAFRFVLDHFFIHQDFLTPVIFVLAKSR